jgi:hypothetical protein
MAQEIREYLESLITSAREGSYIFPPEAASEKIANEIERRTKLKVQNLAERDVETIERRVYAHVTNFVEDTLRAINDVVASLESSHATAVELRFVNPAEDPEWDFGWVKLLVKYTK